MRPVVPWGAATSAGGAFGLAPASDWSGWEREGRLPASADGSGLGVDHGSDMELLAGLGLRSVRLTLDWARLEPRPGRWDADAIDRFTEVLRSARKAGLEVWAALVDGPLPGWFSDDAGGFRDDDGRRRTWPRHVDRVAETFGDLVGVWIPIMTPFDLASDGYLTGRRPPGRRRSDQFLETLRALHLASAEALRLLRSGTPPVACCVDTIPLAAGIRGPDPEERRLADALVERMDRLRHRVWVRALNDGLISLPGGSEIEVEGLAGGYDIVGLTHHGGLTLFADDTVEPLGARTAASEQVLVDAAGRAPWAAGCRDSFRRVAEDIPARPLALLGTGLTSGSDEWRTDLLEGVHDALTSLREDGVHVAAAFWEGVIDEWTPATGFDVPTGMVDRSRHERPSAAVFGRHHRSGATLGE